MKANLKKDFLKAREQTGILLPYQVAWVEDTSDVKLYEKSRRIGISWAEAADDVLIAAAGTGDDIWYIGYNLDMAREFIGDCAKWAEHYGQAASEMEQIIVEDPKKDISAFRITFASGNKITALSSRPTNLRGKQGIIVIDEAAFHDDLPGLIKAAMAMLIWGGKVRIISTHNGDDNEFNSLIQDIRAGKLPYSLHRTELDEALADGLYRRICEVLGRTWTPDAESEWRQEVIDFYSDDADEELFCIPSQGSGTYLTRALIEKCMSPDIPVVRYAQTSAFAEMSEYIRRAEVDDWCKEELLPLLETLESRPSYFGEDFARNVDLTAIVPLQEMQDTVLRAPFVVELWNVPFRQQEQILYYICDRVPRFCGGALDARGNGQYLAEVAMQRYGAYRIHQVMLSEAWYREYMPRYKAAFEDRTILLPRDADIIADNRAIKKIRGIAKVPDVRTTGKDKKKRHGDTAIAGALAVYAAYELEGGGPIEYESTGHRRSYSRMGNYMGR